MSNGARRKEREFDFSRYRKRKIALMFLYFGWEYNGLVEQREITRTVEAELRKALLKTKLIESWENCGWNRSGRTDSGVSAFKQIASVIVRSNEPVGDDILRPSAASPGSSVSTVRGGELQYAKMLNGTLPANIRVLAWAPVMENFSARHKCNERTYTYAFPRGTFDVKAMQEACQLLKGEHDFRNFCRIDMNKERVEMSYVRTITYANVSALSHESSSASKTDDDVGSSPYDFYQLTIKGSGFLWHQIRCIMALLYEIGNGNEKPEIINELLDVNLTPSKPTYGLAPAFPLCLFDCSYNETEVLSWKWDIDMLKLVRAHVLKTWVHYQSLSVMLRNMAEGIGSMVPELQNDYSGLNEYLRPNGTRSKTYVPITKRPTCDALELKKEKIRAKMEKLIANSDSTAAE